MQPEILGDIFQDVAEDVGMHESTISRVTTNKYVHTPQGIYELKYFFNSSINRVGGDSIASESVRDHIKRLIEEENHRAPYSDQESSRCSRNTTSISRDALLPSTAKC